MEEYDKEVNHYELRVGDRIERFDHYLTMKEKFREHLQSSKGNVRIRAFAIFNDDTFLEVLDNFSINDLTF
jgi:hypothetical protein